MRSGPGTSPPAAAPVTQPGQLSGAPPSPAGGWQTGRGGPPQRKAEAREAAAVGAGATEHPRPPPTTPTSLAQGGEDTNALSGMLDHIAPTANEERSRRRWRVRQRGGDGATLPFVVCANHPGVNAGRCLRGLPLPRDFWPALVGVLRPLGSGSHSPAVRVVRAVNVFSPRVIDVTVTTAHFPLTILTPVILQRRHREAE